MQILKKSHLFQFLLLFNIFFPKSKSQETPVRFCGDLTIKTPFLDQNSFLKHTILCKSEKLYFRTSIGLFQISSIDYANKLLIVSHNSCSSTSDFVSPNTLSAGFPPPSSPNSLILFNCSNRSSNLSSIIQNCTVSNGFSSSCLVIDDVGESAKNFHPRELNCTHYSRVYRNTSIDESTEKFELGTKISFDIPDHVPNPCNECQKPYGNCGVGLRCICHPIQCKDKVISVGAILKPCIAFFLISLFILMEHFQFQGSPG